MLVSRGLVYGFRWGTGGRLFYRDADERLMVARVTEDADGRPGILERQELFRTAGFVQTQHTFDVSADGERFVFLRVIEDENDEDPLQLTTVLNWQPPEAL